MRLAERLVVRELKERRIAAVLTTGAVLAIGPGGQIEEALREVGLTVDPPVEGQEAGSLGRACVIEEREDLGTVLVGPDGLCALLLHLENA
jgi:hypothetical protein